MAHNALKLVNWHFSHIKRFMSMCKKKCLYPENIIAKE